MGIELKLLTDDPEEIEIVERYWALNPDGTFCGSVKSLLPFREAKKSSTLLLLIQSYATAICTVNPCNKCGMHAEVSSRSQYASARVQQPCKRCLQIEAEEYELAVQADLDARKSMMLERNLILSKDRTKYKYVPDDIRLILLSLLRSLHQDPFRESFLLADCKNLAYSHTQMLAQLLVYGCLRDDPSTSSPYSYEIIDDQVQPKPERARYRLNPDADLDENYEGTWKLMSSMPVNDTVAVYELWLRFAVGDATLYLDYGCRQRMIFLDDDQRGIINKAIRNGLKTLSVSQVWYVIWKSIKHAETMISKRFSATKVSEKIASGIHDNISKAINNPTSTRQWGRPPRLGAGYLGDTFRMIFNIDENTTGPEVMECLNPLARNPDPEVPDLASFFMKRALVDNNSFDALYHYAALIRAGLSAEDALLELVGQGAKAWNEEGNDEHQA